MAQPACTAPGSRAILRVLAQTGEKARRGQEMPGKRILILDQSLSELEEWLRSLGEPEFRARQIYEWIYRELVFDLAGMHNLPKSLRDRLASLAAVTPISLVTLAETDEDHTGKALFRLPDGSTVESVLMRYPATASSRGRNTVCLSSQVGCAIGCAFCATGQSGVVRNLTSGEIVGQALYFARLLRDHQQGSVTNLVFMGQGEPLANFESVWKAIETLNSPYGFGLGARHITISTVGLVPGIRRLAESGSQVGLAVSLHAPDDTLRSQLVPINKRYPLAELMEACRAYIERTSRRVTFEYVLIEDVNDSREQARALATLLRGMLCHVNLIPLNPVPDRPWRASLPERVEAFERELSRKGMTVTVRGERGAEAEGACGQLRSRPMEGRGLSPGPSPARGGGQERAGARGAPGASGSASTRERDQAPGKNRAGGREAARGPGFAPKREGEWAPGKSQARAGDTTKRGWEPKRQGWRGQPAGRPGSPSQRGGEETRQGWRGKEDARSRPFPTRGGEPPPSGAKDARGARGERWDSGRPAPASGRSPHPGPLPEGERGGGRDVRGPGQRAQESRGSQGRPPAGEPRRGDEWASSLRGGKEAGPGGGAGQRSQQLPPSRRGKRAGGSGPRAQSTPASSPRSRDDRPDTPRRTSGGAPPAGGAKRGGRPYQPPLPTDGARQPDRPGKPGPGSPPPGGRPKAKPPRA